MRLPLLCSHSRCWVSQPQPQPLQQWKTNQLLCSRAGMPPPTPTRPHAAHPSTATPTCTVAGQRRHHSHTVLRQELRQVFLPRLQQHCRGWAGSCVVATGRPQQPCYANKRRSHLQHTRMFQHTCMCIHTSPTTTTILPTPPTPPTCEVAAVDYLQPQPPRLPHQVPSQRRGGAGRWGVRVGVRAEVDQLPPHDTAQLQHMQWTRCPPSPPTAPQTALPSPSPPAHLNCASAPARHQ